MSSAAGRGRSVPARRGHGPAAAAGPGRAGTGGDPAGSGGRGGPARLGPAWPGPARLVPAWREPAALSSAIVRRAGGVPGAAALRYRAERRPGPPPHSPPGRGAGARRGWAKGLTGCGALFAQRGAPARLTPPRPTGDRRPFAPPSPARGWRWPELVVVAAGAVAARGPAGEGGSSPRWSGSSGTPGLAGAGRRRVLSQSRPKSPSRSFPGGPGQGSRLTAACPPPCCPSLGGTHRCHGCPERGTARLCRRWAPGWLPEPSGARGTAAPWAASARGALDSSHAAPV